MVQVAECELQINISDALSDTKTMGRFIWYSLLQK